MPCKADITLPSSTFGNLAAAGCHITLRTTSRLFSDQPLCSIVAIHGLNGHREKTWTFEGKGKTSDVMWLRDLLPSIIPNARIWTWGYDSRTRSKSHGEQLTIKSLYDHGRELVFDLDGERRASNSHRRPIIFIVHSLGGIVVKSALLHSDRVREGNLEEQRSIKLSTYGIIFMGTPHQGGQGVGIGKIMLNVAKAQGHTSDNLLKHLEAHSEVLQQQLSEFTSISQDLKMYFAYETKPTPIVGVVAMVIVPKWSAVVPGTADAAEFGISEDHRRMTKFPNAENADFRKIVRILASMMKNAGAKVESNWRVEVLRKRAALGAKAFEVPFNIQGVPIVNKYVERDREMLAIESSLRPGVANTQRRIVVLHGLGGTGKTQLSLAYARKHRDDHTAIFWLNGQTRDSLKQSIAGVARSLPANQLPDSARKRLQQGSEELEETIDEVLEWFGKPENTQWLLIYDNIDRDATDEGQDPEAYDICKYFPKPDHGSIIITTRRLQLRHLGDELKVNTMTTEEGIDLLRNTLGDFEDDFSSATTLVNRLGALPLALAQAAAYIRETNCSIAKYLSSYDTTWKALMEDESHPDFALREYDYRSVYTTWNVSFECVKQKDEDAAKMLQLWSYLNNKQNWNLRLWYSLPKWFERVMGKEVDFRGAVRILLAYSLIEAKEDSDAFAMHPVVHDWCRETLDASSRHEFVSLAITVVGYALPHHNERNYWEIELRLLPHAGQCITFLDHLVEERLREDDLLDLNEAFWKLGRLFADHLKFAEAEAMYQWVLESRKKNFRGKIDRKSDLIPRLHNSFGNLYLQQKKLDKAEAMFQRALTGYEELSGSDTEDTMMVINNLGLVYEEQGKLAEAEAMYKRVLAWSTDTLGSAHVKTVDTVMNLGRVYLHQGNSTEAESSLKRALAVQEDKLGPEHPTTLRTISNLGRCHQDQKRFEEAEVQLKRALSGREKILGSDHTRTVDTRYDLGQTLFAQGRFVESEIQFERALSGYKKNKNYEWTKYAAVELSRTYKKQRRLAEAEATWQRLLTEFEAALGPDNILTLDVCFEIGRLLMDQDDEAKLVDADSMLQRALLGYRKVLGLDHRSTATASYNLGVVLGRQGKLHEAEDMFQQALSRYKNVYGLDHEHTVDTQYYLGLVLKDQGKLHEVEDMFQQALSGHKNFHGSDHEYTLNTLYNLGLVLTRQGKLHEAEDMLQQALSGEKKVLGMDHESTLNTSHTLGLVLKRQGKLHEAEDMLQQALSGYKKVLGMDDEETVKVLYNLGTVLKSQGKLHEAEDMFQQALLGYKKIKGPDHQDTKDTVNELSEIYEKQGRRKEAKALYNEYHDTTDSSRRFPHNSLGWKTRRRFL